MPHRTRKETQEWIMTFLYNEGPKTRGQVAAYLGVKVSPHLIEILDEMVIAGWINVEFQNVGPLGRHVYSYIPE